MNKIKNRIIDDFWSIGQIDFFKSRDGLYLYAFFVYIKSIYKKIKWPFVDQ